MKQIAYKTLVGIFMSFFLFGQTITVDAPRVVLKNIEFNISYSGDFFNSDSLIMRVNGAIIQASNYQMKRLFIKILLLKILGKYPFNFLKEPECFTSLTVR